MNFILGCSYNKMGEKDDLAIIIWEGQYTLCVIGLA